VPRGPAASRWGSAAIYDTVVAHARAVPVRHAFRHRSYCWLVDLDDLPRPPRFLRPLAEFRAQDHLGRPDMTLRQNLDAHLAAQGIDLRGGRILMLANARTLGYVFNPLSVFWCHDPHGELVCVVAEVHNTYGDRHCYLLRPDATGRAAADKAFYVSPFFTVDGRYEMTFTDPRVDASNEAGLRVAITLSRDEQVVFRASLEGHPDPTAPSFLVGALRHPGGGLRVTALIRLQGIRLWLKHLPVVPRPAAPVQEGVTA
jgi:DUF1365 family protein